MTGGTSTYMLIGEREQTRANDEDGFWPRAGTHKIGGPTSRSAPLCPHESSTLDLGRREEGRELSRRGCFGCLRIPSRWLLLLE